jgi:putative oxidoreductase
MSQPATHRPTSRTWHVALWVIQIVLAAAYLAAGFSKLAGTPEAMVIFDQVGLGDWFRYLIGTLEVVVAIMLLIPRLCGLAAVALLVLILVAIAAHVAIGDVNAVVFLVPLVLAAIVAVGRRDRIRLSGGG